MSTPLSSGRPGSRRALHRRPAAHRRPGQAAPIRLRRRRCRRVGDGGLATAAMAAAVVACEVGHRRPAVKRQASAAFSYDLVTALGSRLQLRWRRLLRRREGRHLAAPIVAMAVTPDGRGYWLAGTDGSVFSFGDADVYGSLASRGARLGQQIVTIVATADGKGYWLVNQSGAVTPSATPPPIDGGQPLPASDLSHADRVGRHRPGRDRRLVHRLGRSRLRRRHGHWFGSRVDKRRSRSLPSPPCALRRRVLAGRRDGEVWAFGCHCRGRTAPAGLAGTAVGMIPAQNRHGYWVATSNGTVISGGDATARASSGVSWPASPTSSASPARPGQSSPQAAGGRRRLRHQLAAVRRRRVVPAGALPGPPDDPAGSGAYSIAVVGVDGWAVDDNNPCLAAEAAWAQKAVYPNGSGGSGAPPYDLYMFLNSPASRLDHRPDRARRDVRRALREGWQNCLAYNYGYNSALEAVSYASSQGAHSRSWWLDIENDACAPGHVERRRRQGEWWSCDLGLNAKTIQGAIDGLRSLGSSRPASTARACSGPASPAATCRPADAPLIWIAGAIWTSPPYPQSYGFAGPASEHESTAPSRSTGSPAATRSCCRRHRAAATTTLRPRRRLLSSGRTPQATAASRRASNWTQSGAGIRKPLRPAHRCGASRWPASL